MEPKHPLKGYFVVDLRPGERITAYFLVRHKQLEPFRDRSKGEFLTLQLADRTGQLLARVWDGAPDLAETFVEGDIIKVAGDLEDYMGRTQLIVQKLRQAVPDEYDLADFLPATEKSVAEMLARVDALIAGLGNSHLRALVEAFYARDDFRERLQQAPAARRIHHAYLGGLLEHMIEVLALADTVITLYPEVNADLLRTGVLLHDIGKLREYTWEPDIDYTDEGRLLGHVIMGDEWVTQALAQLPDFPAELAMRVRHMIVSHHGRYEWGSPRRPQTLEALALHHIENLSAQMGRFRSLLAARREPGQAWTGYDRLLDRQLYAGHGDDLAIEESSQQE